MKSVIQERFFSLPRTSLKWLLYQASYRVGMRVTEMIVYQSAFGGQTGYYRCPRCHITMDREFMAFCDRCGQHLDWKDYQKAKVIYPGKQNNI